MKIIELHALLRIVTAVLATDEDHSGGDSRIGEHCSVMPGTAWQRQCWNARTCRETMEAPEQIAVHQRGMRLASCSKIEGDAS